MTQILFAYANWPTDKRDLAAQKGIFTCLRVTAHRIYTDHGFTGTSRARSGLDQSLAASREGDTLAGPKLDWLARSVPDARDIADSFATRGIKIQLGTTLCGLTGPMRTLFLNILATLFEFGDDLVRTGTREGMAVARAKGKLRGKKQKLSERQQQGVRRMYETGVYFITGLTEVSSISRSTECKAQSEGCRYDYIASRFN